MKTPMQELIDEAIKYSRELSTEGHLNESLAVDHIIDLAESMLPKEEELIIKTYNHAALHGMLIESGKEKVISAQRYYIKNFKTKENDDT